ncbi:MAG: exodeoxyribonuclease VII small subunit [Patescibacteria group bacterium]|nr:exodeoxyribonuclease VII small subunit [Patescibacteria group bacterium]
MPKKEDKLDLGKTFEQLEKITTELSSQDLDLEAAIEKFERGLKLSEQLKTRLSEIENRIETIKLKFKDTLSEDSD